MLLARLVVANNILLNNVRNYLIINDIRIIYPLSIGLFLVSKTNISLGFSRLRKNVTAAEMSVKNNALIEIQ